MKRAPLPPAEDRPAVDEAVDAHRLARSVVDELDLGFLEQFRLRVVELVFHHARRAHDPLGRDTVDPLGPRVLIVSHARAHGSAFTNTSLARRSGRCDSCRAKVAVALSEAARHAPT